MCDHEAVRKMNGKSWVKLMAQLIIAVYSIFFFIQICTVLCAIPRAIFDLYTYIDFNTEFYWQQFPTLCYNQMLTDR